LALVDLVRKRRDYDRQHHRIDDKILIKSAEAGTPWFAHAYRYERELHEAYVALGCMPPTYEPRATGHIPEMIEMIKVLIERGHGYRRLMARAMSISM
jgi:cysteinyl-tRNA synthetase